MISLSVLAWIGNDFSIIVNLYGEPQQTDSDEQL